MPTRKVAPRHADPIRPYKILTANQQVIIEAEIKAMLHASRDCLRNQGRYDTAKIQFDCRDGYYGEAFGMMRTLMTLGYGYFGSVNINGRDEGRGTQDIHNLKWWFSELENEVLEEENFDGSNVCTYCRHKYGKDTATLYRQEMKAENG